MSSVIENLKQKEFFCSLQGKTDTEILQAQEALGLQFAKDYRVYLETFGLASYEGHELTGLCPSKRLNVIDVTQHDRERTSGIQDDWYVIEETNIDDIIIWQDSKGVIYQTAPGSAPEKIHNSLSEYINS